MVGQPSGDFSQQGAQPYPPTPVAGNFPPLPRSASTPPTTAGPVPPAPYPAGSLPAQSPDPESAAASPTEPDPESVGGLGDQPDQPLLSLPPIEAAVGGYPLSKRTGEPKRSLLVLLTIGLLIASATWAFGCYWLYWWRAIHMATFPTSAKLIELFEPRPGSTLSVVLVCVMALLGVAMSFSPGGVAYNLWRGMDFTRISVLVTGGVGLLAFFFFPAMWISTALSALAAILTWLPPMKPYFTAWSAFNDPPRRPVVPSTEVAYGPAPRFR